MRANYTNARMNLLLAAIFTLINVVMILMGQDSYFLFSMSIPYVIAFCGALFCGTLPQEYYEQLFGYQRIFKPYMIYVFAAIAVAIILLYVICFIFSKKRVGFLVTALVLFSLDTAFMFLWYGLNLSILLDILFHGWLIGSLIVGVRSYYKLKKMPEDVIPSEVEEENEISALDAESNEIESTASDDFADIKEN
jgi:hypothetical protein